MALSTDKRGLYGQTESDKAIQVAAVERIADADAESHIVGSEGDYVKKMADFRRSQFKHSKAETTLANRGAMLGVTVARTGQRAALQGVANLAEEMRVKEFSHDVIMGAINRSEGLAAHIDRTERCTQIAPTMPNYDGKARIRGSLSTINNAARNGLLDKHRGLKPRPSANTPIIPIDERDCGKDDGDGDTNKRYIV